MVNLLYYHLALLSCFHETKPSTLPKSNYTEYVSTRILFRTWTFSSFYLFLRSGIQGYCYISWQSNWMVNLSFKEYINIIGIIRIKFSSLYMVFAAERSWNTISNMPLLLSQVASPARSWLNIRIGKCVSLTFNSQSKYPIICTDHINLNSWSDVYQSMKSNAMVTTIVWLDCFIVIEKPLRLNIPNNLQECYRI